MQQRKLAEFVEENYSAWESDEEALDLKAVAASYAAKARVASKSDENIAKIDVS